MRQLPWMVACALSAGMSCGAGAGVVGYWDCNGFDPAVSMNLTATAGSGTLNVSSFGDGASSFGGTELNAMEGIDPGDAVGLSGSSHNGAYAQIDTSTAGMVDLNLSFAIRRSGTGFGTNSVQALIGGNWTSVATFTASSTAWSVVAIDLSAIDALENGLASIRLVFDGATSGSGTVRFDNVMLAGTVPAPGALALLGAAGIVGRRRRRS